MQLDIILRAHEAARGRQRGHHQQPVADVGIGDVEQLAGAVEGNDDIGAVFADDAARDRERARRHGHSVGDGDGPGRAVGIDAGQTRARQAQAHDRFAFDAARNGC